MDKDIRVEIRNAEESAQEFIKAWQRAEAGESTAGEAALFPGSRSTPPGADTSPA